MVSLIYLFTTQTFLQGIIAKISSILSSLILSTTNISSLENKSIIKKSFNLLEKGLKNNDLKLIGEACTLSSLANENIHKKPYLNEIIEISQNMNAYGVNIAHSGTVIGILIDKNMDYERIINHLNNLPLSDYYKKIHLANIIGQKEREELEWNMLKILK